MRRSMFFFLFILFFNTLRTQTIHDQSAYVWDLSEIYSTDREWHMEYERAKTRIESTGFADLQTFTSSLELSKVLDDISNLRAWVSKLSAYAILRWEEGKVENADAFLELGESLQTRFESLLSELEGIIYSIDKDTLRSWLMEESTLFVHRHWLNLVLDQKEFRAHPEAELVLRKTRSWVSSSIDIYWELQSLDQLWPMHQNEEGKPIRLSRSTFRNIRGSYNLAFRNSAAEVFYQNLDDLKQIYGTIYTQKIRSELNLAQLRGFEDGIDANWSFYSGVPNGGYKVYIDAARANTETLQRYAKLRAKVLEVDSLHYLDFFRLPAAINEVAYDFATTMEIALESSQHVSSAFHENMKTVMDNKHWMHLADIPKNARYHIRPPVSGIHPFLILKYRPRIIESRALVGGLFQLAASVSTIGADGIDIFENEAPVHISGVIYAGDLLFDQAIVNRTKSKEGKIAYLLESLEFMRRFFKNAILVELDAKVQRQMAKGEFVSGKEVSEIYLELLRTYYGHEQGITNVPAYLKHDWMIETPVLYMPKYEHHFWGPSLAIGAALIDDDASEMLKRRFLPDFTEDRIDSYSTLRAANFDLMNSRSYAYLIKEMNQIMDEIEELLAHH